MIDYKQITYKDITINDGFWKNRQKINEETTIFAVENRFRETGRFEAFKFKTTNEKPHIFWDSDVAKWIESAAYILQKKEDKNLEASVDEIVDLVEKNQDTNGYFNIYFTVCEPENRFKFRTHHELYCAGHLIEAAVAYFEATGKDKFLKCMIKYADHIEKVFKIEQTSAFKTPGHEEIELALVKLYHCTGEKRYLELSKFFIDNKGKDSDFYNFANAFYTQDHLPVRQQTTAEGHSVRACYLYSGMADIAREYDDYELFNACHAILENIAYKRMYITGGIGSSSSGETFTIDYDLPNSTAYAETCAGIALALFAQRMYLIEPDSFYGAITEQVIYNGLLSGVSLDGKSFFYENPLEFDRKLHNSNSSTNSSGIRYPITKRLEVFGCSCCPPNLTRFIASIGNFIYTKNDDTLFIHQFINSTAEFDGASVIIESDYPHEGIVTIKIKSDFKVLAMRIPKWSNEFDILINGEEAEAVFIKGYAYIPISGAATVVFSSKMEVFLVEANPEIQENSGRVALFRGPLLYCLESQDNGPLLRDIVLDTTSNFEIEFDEYFGANVIYAQGYRRSDFRCLYRILKPSEKKLRLKFIPYYAFANRESDEMLVWTRYK